MIFWCYQNARTQIAIVENHQDRIMAKVNSNDSVLANVETNGSEKYHPRTYIENKSMMLAKGNMVTETYSNQSTSRKNPRRHV